MEVKLKGRVGDTWHALSREFKTMLWAILSLTLALFGVGHWLYGMVFIWDDVPRSTQHLIAGLVCLYISDHPALKKHSGEDKE